MDESYFKNLPPDLQDLARALVTHRETPDGHLLERVEARVKASPKPRRRVTGFFRARLAALSMVVLCLGLNVSGALAAILQSVGFSKTSANSVNLSNLFSQLTTTISTSHTQPTPAETVYCPPDHGKGGSDDNQMGGSEQNGGSENNGGSKSDTSIVNSSPVTSYVHGVRVTTYTHTTTTTTHNSSEQNGGSENNGNPSCVPCPPSNGGSGSENNGGSENVHVQVETYTNGKLTNTTTSNSTKSGDNGGSESNGGSEGNNQCPPPPKEKPGCGNEHNIGISGNSGAHGGQPPKQEERGDCPHMPGVDGH